MNLKKWIRPLFWIAFAVYCLALFYILFLNARYHRYQGESLFDYIRFSVNLKPLKTIIEYIAMAERDSYFISLAVRNIVGNLILFLPMGIFLPTLFRKMRHLWKTMLCIFLMILSAELIQLFLRLGIFDIDDFILNMLGAFLGYFIFQLFYKIYCKKISFCGIMKKRKEGAIDGNQIE